MFVQPGFQVSMEDLNHISPELAHVFSEVNVCPLFSAPRWTNNAVSLLDLHKSLDQLSVVPTLPLLPRKLP